LWRYGIGENDLTHNPLLRFQYIGESVKRRGFTDDEARKILLAAREETDPLLRWAPWIMAANGARISEIVGSRASAVMKRNGHWCLDLQDGRGERPSTRMPGEMQKNVGSNGTVPLPGWLIDEGFLDYWRALPNDGALFPGVTPSPDDGKRSHNATKTIGKWIRVKNDVELIIAASATSRQGRWREVVRRATYYALLTKPE
jgi:integrase